LKALITAAEQIGAIASQNAAGHVPSADAVFDFQQLGGHAGTFPFAQCSG